MGFWDVLFYFYVFATVQENRLVFNNCNTPPSSRSSFLPFSLFRLQCFLLHFSLESIVWKQPREMGLFSCPLHEGALRESRSHVQRGCMGSLETEAGLPGLRPTHMQVSQVKGCLLREGWSSQGAKSRGSHRNLMKQLRWGKRERMACGHLAEQEVWRITCGDFRLFSVNILSLNSCLDR